MADEFDVQRTSPLTPEGQIESAGHFGRGLSHRYGPDRVRRTVGRAALAIAVVIVVAAIVAAVA